MDKERPASTSPRSTTASESRWFDRYAGDVNIPLEAIQKNIKVLQETRASFEARHDAVREIVRANAVLFGVTQAMLVDTYLAQNGTFTETRHPVGATP